MRNVTKVVLLSLLALLANPIISGVEGADVLRANEDGDERQASLDNVDVERELQRRRRNGGGGGKGKGKGGKGKGGGSSKGRSGGIGRSGSPIRFLPDRIEPIPFVNCIPLPPGSDLDGRMMGKSKGAGGRSGSGGGGGKGKGGKGKGHRRNNRSGMIRERDLHQGMIRHGRNRGGTRNGARRGGDRDQEPKKMKMMRMARLPFCPGGAPTLFPTALPSFTPIPTATPLPSITPFPSFTPLPTGDGTPTSPDDGPTSPPDGPTTAPAGGGTTTAPVVPGAPTVTPATPGGGAPVATPPGTQRILVESSLAYRFFAEVTAREPTQAEIDGLMVETTRFYNDILSAAYPNLESFDATFVSSTFTPTDNLPVLIDFDANAFFTEGTTAPTPAEVFATLEGADYQNYIEEYVWNSAPEGTIFFDTQEVAYNARVLPGR